MLSFSHTLDPPSIIYTTEFIISKKEVFGKSGQLTCTVQTSPDTSSSVSWFAKGSEISNNTKYSTITLPVEEEHIIRYQLTVSDLHETDIGPYLCRLSSTHGIEDMQDAWIQVDYRKGACLTFICMMLCMHKSDSNQWRIQGK